MLAAFEPRAANLANMQAESRWPPGLQRCQLARARPCTPSAPTESAPCEGCPALPADELQRGVRSAIELPMHEMQPQTGDVVHEVVQKQQTGGGPPETFQLKKTDSAFPRPFNNHSGLRGLPCFAEVIHWATGSSLTTPFTEGCPGVNDKASPPGRHQEQAPERRCTFSPTAFSSVQFSSVRRLGPPLCGPMRCSFWIALPTRGVMRLRLTRGSPGRSLGSFRGGGPAEAACAHRLQRNAAPRWEAP